MEIEIDVNEIAELVADKLGKPKKVWDNYVPIMKTDDKITIYFTEGISLPAEYNEACYELIHAEVPVELVINTPGGVASSAFMVCDAMAKCTQPIHGVITGSVASAGTIITMKCDTIEVADHTDFMCHNYNHGTSGSGAQVKDYVNFADREFTKAVKELYAGFLTPEEMTAISEQDKEIWLNKSEVLERWNNRTNI